MSDCTQCADYEWCAKNEECGMFKPKTMTNADRLRSMTDEELADFLDETDPVYWDRQTWLDWLREKCDK